MEAIVRGAAQSSYIESSIVGKLLGIVVLISVFGLTLGTEITCQIAYRIVQGEWLFDQPQGETSYFVRHPYLVGTGNPLLRHPRVTHNSMGYRGKEVPEKKPGTTRIVTLGGSTTYCVYLNEEHTWPAVLERKLGAPFEVINLGIPGYSTVENLIQTAFVLSDLQPDIAIYYEGWNDSRVQHIKNLQGDYSNFHARQLYEALQFRRSPFQSHRIAILYFLQRYLWSDATEDPLSVYNLERGPDALTEHPDPRAQELYRRNLTSLAALTRSMKIAPIFVPQLLNFTQLTGDKPYGWAPFIRDKDYQKVIVDYNHIMASVARDQRVAFASPLLESPFPESEFLDNGHFNEQGAEHFADVIAAFIKSRTIQN